MNGIVIWALEGGKPFAKGLSESLEQLGESASLPGIIDGFFPVDETKFQARDSVRGRHVVIVQDVANAHAPGSLNDKLWAVYGAADSARRSGAESVNIVMPYLPYARQDKPNRDFHEPASAALVAQFFDDMVTNWIPFYLHTIDLHSAPVETNFRAVQIFPYRASKVIADHVRKEIGTSQLVIGATDATGIARNRELADLLGVEVVGAIKRRDPATQEIIDHYLVGSVEGKKVVVNDDMIDTGGSMLETVELMKANGTTAIYVSATHLLLSGNGEEKLASALKSGRINGVIATNSVYKDNAFKDRNPGIAFVPVQGILAKGILSNLQRQSVQYT